MGKPAERRAKRSERKRDRKERAASLQDWLTSRKEAVEKKLKEDRNARQERRKEVAARNEPQVEWQHGGYKPLVEHGDANYAQRRQAAKNDRPRIKRAARETIFHKKDVLGNPTFDKVEVEGTLGRAVRVQTRPGSNRPYVNPNRDEKRGKRRK